MNKILLIAFMVTMANYTFAVCSSPISRTNFSSNQVLTSTRLNSELNAVYSRVNELPGDCITDETITSAKITNGTIVNADVSSSAAIAMNKIAYSVAYLSDQKASGVDGGTNGSAAYDTRTLNTEVDPDSIVTLSSDQFTLQSGTYLIEGFAPGYKVGAHRALIYNVTDSAIALLGQSSYSGAGDAVMTNSPISGMITISSAKVFEVRHKFGVTQATTGLGISLGDASNNEVYTLVKITKIK